MKKIYILLILIISIKASIKAQTVLPSVTIGTQIWALNNLDVTTYSDGTPIPQVTSPTDWGNLTTGAWCYYNNDSTIGANVGKLYNWYAVAGIYNSDSYANSALRKSLAPTGWHIPSDTEWTILTTFLGGINVAGSKLKGQWPSSSQCSTNSSGFSGLPCGYRDMNGSYMKYHEDAYWWSSTGNFLAGSGYYRALYTDVCSVGSADLYKSDGFSVRCLSNQSLSIDDQFFDHKIVIYPNPSYSLINLSLNERICIEKVTILDITGKVVLEQNENSSIINVEKLAKGVYILLAYAGDTKYQEKFIKE